MKTHLSRILNLALWLVGSVLASTGLILAFRLPPGSRGGRGLSLLTWGRHEWGDLHTWFSYAAIALVTAHLLIHSRWLWVVACQRRWPRLAAGLALGLALPAAALLWPVAKQGGADHDSESRPSHTAP
jgi:hypothetical protein